MDANEMELAERLVVALENIADHLERLTDCISVSDVSALRTRTIGQG